jgi:hypothetical protein
VDAFWPKTALLKSRVSGKNRCSFVGGSDARIIMGDDEEALLRLWREKRGESEPKDLSGNLLVYLIVTAERKFWRCVESGETPSLFGVDSPKPRIEAVRIVDMTSSNAWAEFAAIFSRTRSAHLEHEQAKAELKSLVPEDAQQAIGYGVRAKRSKSGAISFDVVSAEGSGHAAI